MAPSGTVFEGWLEDQPEFFEVWFRRSPWQTPGCAARLQRFQSGRLRSPPSSHAARRDLASSGDSAPSLAYVRVAAGFVEAAALSSDANPDSLLRFVLLDLHITCQAIECLTYPEGAHARAQAYDALLLNILHPFNPS